MSAELLAEVYGEIGLALKASYASDSATEPVFLLEKRNLPQVQASGHLFRQHQFPT